MNKAYVLINCRRGTEAALIEELKELDNIKSVHSIKGVYDIIAEVEADSNEELRQVITWRIRKLENVRSTLTLIGQTKHDDRIKEKLIHA